VRQIASAMPLTAIQAAAIGQDAFSGLTAVCAIHHMRDFTTMANALVACGVDPSLMTIIDKGYPYANRDVVDSWLREELGATMVRYPDRATGIEAHLDRAAAAGKKTIVFDDGGYVLPVVLDMLPGRVGEFVGVVEQTTSGIRRLDRFPDLPVPVFSVAESALKAAVEAPHVAESVIAAVTDMLHDEMFAGRPALVIGYGNLGRQATKILKDSLRMRVAVYDAEPVRLVTAHQDGFHVSRDLAGLLRQHRPLLVLGAAGAGSLTGGHATDFTAPAYLASMTSRDYEFPLAEWAEAAEHVADFGDLGHAYVMPGGVELCVLGDGLPLNFHHRESMANRISDLVFAALLAGGAVLAEPGARGHGPGRNVPLVDKILAASPVMSAYLDLYADEGARELLTPRAAEQPLYRHLPWRYGPAADSPTVEKVFDDGPDLPARFAEHLAAVRSERTQSPGHGLPTVTRHRPEPPGGHVRIPHLLAVTGPGGQVGDIVIWEVMLAADVEPWCGLHPERVWFEHRLDPLLELRRRLRTGDLDHTRAVAELHTALVDRYLSIRFAYQHQRLIAAVLAEMGTEAGEAAA
jgi:S-adenosylhomocysteine hydrolase